MIKKFIRKIFDSFFAIIKTKIINTYKSSLIVKSY